MTLLKTATKAHWPTHPAKAAMTKHTSTAHTRHLVTVSHRKRTCYRRDSTARNSTMWTPPANQCLWLPEDAASLSTYLALEGGHRLTLQSTVAAIQYQKTTKPISTICAVARFPLLTRRSRRVQTSLLTRLMRRHRCPCALRETKKIGTVCRLTWGHQTGTQLQAKKELSIDRRG